MPRYDVFLSHSSADKPAVEILARKLRKAGLQPFLDKWHLVPGDPWQEALEEALYQSRTCAVFLGKTLSPWQNEEMRSALDEQVRNRSYRVIPVLLPGGKPPGEKDLPRFLRRRTWIDFRAGLDDEDAFHRLLAGIRGEAPGPGGEGEPHSLLDRYRSMAPAREPFVQRSEYAKVRDALLAEEDGRATTVGITTAIHGAGGFGKTALAIELCYDERVREKYPDGILWTTMGEEIDAAGRLSRVRDLIRWWTEEDSPAFETVSAASAHLRQELTGKRVLLVVDDVWRPEDVTPFQGLAALLVTTRDSRTLPVGSVQAHVDGMEIPEAVQMLEAGLPDGTGVDLQGFAKRLGEWPLLLKLVNRQVMGWIDKGLDLHEAILRAENALKAKGLTYFDLKDAKERSQAAALTLEVSLERLPKEDQKRFAKLAIFPEDANVPLTILEKLWQLDAFDLQELASRLFDLSLLRSLDLHFGTIRLHDVIRAYLLKKGESHLPEWNQCLLDVFRPANGQWPDLPRDEYYLWNHLIYHLMGAGQGNLCRGLLLNFRYLSSKLRATDVNALLADYSVFTENDGELRLVRDALRLSAHVLAMYPAELPGQLLGRLLDRREEGIRGLIQASESSGAPWLRPRKARLTEPGGPLIRTIDEPSGTCALAALPDGRVVSGSIKGTLEVWDLDSGQILQVLKGHSFGVLAVAVLDSCRVVSGSIDGTLRVWDLESGQALQVLEGHSSWVRSVAVLDGSRVISGSFDKTVRVWNVENGEIFRIFEVTAEVGFVAALGNQRVVSYSVDGMFWVWDVESGKALRVLDGSDWGETVSVLNGGRVISRSYDGTMKIWDVESGQTLGVLKGHSARVSAVAVLSDCRVVTSSSDGMLRVWDVESGQALVFEEHSKGSEAMAVLTDRRIVTSCTDHKLRVWDVESSQSSRTVERHSSDVAGIVVLDKSRVVSGSGDGTLRVWDVESGQTLHILNGHSERISPLAVLRNCRVITQYGGLRIWDVESGQVLHVLGEEQFPGFVTSAEVLDDHKIVFGFWDGSLRVWDIASEQVLQVLLVEHSSSAGLIEILDEARDSTTALDKHYQVVSDILENVFDFAKGLLSPIGNAYAGANAVEAIAVDSHRIVSGSRDGRLQIWDASTSQARHVLEGHSSGVKVVVVLDSRWVVSGSDDRTLRVWDMESGQALHVFEGHSDGINVGAALDNRRVVSGSKDQTLRVWNVESGRVECLFTLEAAVTALAVIPDRRIIVAGDSYGRVHFFDFVEG